MPQFILKLTWPKAKMACPGTAMHLASPDVAVQVKVHFFKVPPNWSLAMDRGMDRYIDPVY